MNVGVNMLILYQVSFHERSLFVSLLCTTPRCVSPSLQSWNVSRNDGVRNFRRFDMLNDNNFVKFKVYEYNQSHHEKVSSVDIPIWQMIHYHFFTFQDDHLQHIRDFIVANAAIFNECKILFVPIFDQIRIRNDDKYR